MNNNTVWGVDAGLRGCIVSVTDKKVTHILRMPTEPHPTSKIIKEIIDLNKLHIDISDLPEPDWVVMELPDPIANNSHVTQASLFMSIGMVWAACAGYCSNIITVQPQTWKVAYNLRKKPKRESNNVANQIYKGLNVQLVKDADISEAALVAHWGIHYSGKITLKERGTNGRIKTLF